MRMLNNVHDSLGHKGVYVTQHLLEKHFWWPELYKDIEWYVVSCIPCQHQQLKLIKALPGLMHMPSLFQKIHVDTINMSPASNGCKYIVHG